MLQGTEAPSSSLSSLERGCGSCVPASYGLDEAELMAVSHLNGDVVH